MQRVTAEIAPGRAAVGSAPEARLGLAAAVAGFALLTALGARVSVPLPFTPVPGTLQTVPALLAGLFLGARAGAASQAVYLLIGVAGLPVFALPGAGPAYLLGPTGGYLVGLAAAAWVTGRVHLRLRRRGLAGRLVALVAGSAAVYACGLSWLVVHLGGDAAATLRAGLIAFLPLAVAKIVIAAAIHSGAISLGPRISRRWKSAS